MILSRAVTLLKKVSVSILVIIAAVAFVLAALFLILPNAPEPQSFTYGITFSKPFAEKLGLDWKTAYLAALDWLGVKTVRLIAYWPEIEPQKGVYDFGDLDWQIAEAKKRGIGIMLSVGQKLPRWPECHYPLWLPGGATDRTAPLSADEESELLAYLRAVVERYRTEPAITHWQVENEPFLPFGICPPLNEALLDKELALVKSLDSSRISIVSEAGELSTWLGAARRTSIVGSTLYRVVWWKTIGYHRYLIPAWFYWKKTTVVKWLYPNVKDVIIVELQGEPWAHLQIYENTVDEMMKSMPPEQFIKNIRFARAARFGTQYLWGVEWWYWMKTTQQQPFYWEYARKTFRNE